MSERLHFVYQIRPKRAGFGPEMTPEEIEAMSLHAAYLARLLEEGTLILAGPCLDFAYGLAVIEAESEEAARSIMLADPSVSRGVMATEFHPFKVSFWRGKS
ncbi:MAG: hypothetical protein J0I20_10260 [Chloroflexi bacterium]|nr:hypothetical protein [Chloroflexota bacterium]OJV94525.1 MAG: hypothetical protein BGO39_22550 [Chloroflexi bacterium 54-19]